MLLSTSVVLLRPTDAHADLSLHLSHMKYGRFYLVVSSAFSKLYCTSIVAPYRIAVVETLGSR